MKPSRLKQGDKVAIVSLSTGILGEKFVKHELDLGIKRLEELGLVPVLMPNSTKGIDYLSKHPEARAQDLKDAFEDDAIKAIICAIGGGGAYELIPYILDADFKKVVKENPKIFMGFSDSTINHLTLNKLGLNTFYGPALLTDFAEFEEDMLSFTKYWVLNLFVNREETKLESSEIWYNERKDFSEKAVGTKRDMLLEENGYISLCKSGVAEGKLYGGCIDVICSIFEPSTKEQKEIFEKHKIWQSTKDKILFLETSDAKPEPEKFRSMLNTLKQNKVFDGVAGILFGKPQDQAFMQEYMQIIKEELAEYKVLFNLNFGHSYPRCIIPYNINCKVDFSKKKVTFTEELFNDKII